MKPMNPRALAALWAILLPLCGAAAAAATDWQLVAGCDFVGSGGGDVLSDGIYLTNFAGSNLSQVQLGYSANVGHSGLYSISLTAHRGAFDGPVIGSTQIATVLVPDLNSGTENFAAFDFNGAPVTPGDTIAFTQSYQGITTDAVSGTLFFDLGIPPCNNVFETGETTPPLGVTIRDHVGIGVTEHVTATTCVASDTVMCIDDLPGDQRFMVTATYHTVQGGGLSGTGQEIPLAPLGVLEGGMFWFFNSANPEMLVKIIDGCATNQRIWVFISAGTNVGFTVTVADTFFGGSKTYTNHDLTAAPPIQDTSALTGCS